MQSRFRDAESARALIAALDCTVAWWGETHFLCRGIERLVDDFLVLPTSPAGKALCDVAGIRHGDLATLSTPPLASRPAGILAFEPSPEIAGRMPANARLLCPDPAVIARLGDKTFLPAILAQARAPGIPGVTVEGACPGDAGGLWDRFRRGKLVVQRPENNHIGKGTFAAESLTGLAEILERHEGETLKISPYVTGDVITASACAHAQGTVISYFSLQLAGIPELTPHWASHCGNEILPETRFGPETIEEFRGITERVGNVLAAHGFLGIFGLDLIVDDRGRAVVVEINPRLHSVGSLINASEIERGCFPILAYHILAFFGADLSAAPRLSDERHLACPYTQIVFLNLGPSQAVTGTLASGSYTLDCRSGLSLVRAGADLAGLKDAGEFLLTMRVMAGETLKPGQRIADIQRRGSMVDGRNQPKTELRRLLASVKTALGLA